MQNPENYSKYKSITVQQVNLSGNVSPDDLFSVSTKTPSEVIDYRPFLKNIDRGRNLDITFLFENFELKLPIKFESKKKIEYYTESIEVVRKYMQTLYEFCIEKFNSTSIDSSSEIRVFDCENIKLQEVDDIEKRNTLMKSIFLIIQNKL